MPTLTDPDAGAHPAARRSTSSPPCPTSAGGSTGRRRRSPTATGSCGFLEDRYLPGLSRHLVTEHMIDPRHFRETLNSYLGSAFSVEPILTQSAWFRPHNRSEELPNLYFVGAGTHPGAGLPGVLSLGQDRRRPDRRAVGLIDPPRRDRGPESPGNSAAEPLDATAPAPPGVALGDLHVEVVEVDLNGPFGVG